MSSIIQNYKRVNKIQTNSIPNYRKPVFIVINATSSTFAYYTIRGLALLTLITNSVFSSILSSRALFTASSLNFREACRWSSQEIIRAREVIHEFYLSAKLQN